MGMQKGMTQSGALICSRPRDCERKVQAIKPLILFQDNIGKAVLHDDPQARRPAFSFIMKQIYETDGVFRGSLDLMSEPSCDTSIQT